MRLKKYIKRTSEEIYSTFQIAKVLGLKKALTTFRGKVDIQKIVRGDGVEYPKYKKVFLKKHDYMNEYFSKTIEEVPLDYINEEPKDELKDCIWICWWQGMHNAPKIVQRCVESIKKNAGKHKVVIITDENYDEYISFPRWVEEKYENGKISRTHLSDILRLGLLSQYGGLWIDATFFCSSSLDQYFIEPLWSIKRPDYRHISVACGYFANYSFGCNLDNRVVFKNIYDYLLQYWKKYDYMVDYLFLDYLIVQAQSHSDFIRQEFNRIKPNNPNCDELVKILSKPYDETIWNEIKKETGLFKLTWKGKFLIEVNGEKTFYGKLIDGELE